MIVTGPHHIFTQPAQPTGRKDDGQKPQMHLLPWQELEEVVRVLEFGAQKYAPGNWMHVPDGRLRYLNAVLRHAADIAKGNRYDSESKLLVAGHLACSALFLIRFEREAASSETTQE